MIIKINNAEHEINKNRCDKNKRCDEGCDTVNTWNFDNRKNNRTRHQ